MKQLFLKTFRDFNLRSLGIVIIDFASFFAVIFLIRAWLDYFRKIVTESPAVQDILLMSVEEAKQALSPDPRLQILFSFLLIVLAVLLTLAFSRSAVWLLSTGFSIKKFFKFAIINFSWYLAIIIPSVLLLFVLKQAFTAIFLIVIIPLFFHYSQALNILLSRKQDFRQVRNALVLGTKKMHLFVLPYIIFMLAFLLIMLLLWGQTVPVVLLSAAALCWARYFILRLIKPLNI